MIMAECKHMIDEATCVDCRPHGQRIIRCRGVRVDGGPCNRELTDTISRYLGIGSTCFLSDTRAQAKVLGLIENAEPGHGRLLGPVDESCAAQWYEAFKQLEGVHVVSRTLDDGIHLWVGRSETQPD